MKQVSFTPSSPKVAKILARSNTFLKRPFYNTCTIELILIRKDVSLRAYDVAFARYLTTETRTDTKDWKVSATLFLDVKEYKAGTLSSTLFLNNSEQITYERQVSVSPQHNSTSLVFSVPKVSSDPEPFSQSRDFGIAGSLSCDPGIWICLISSDNLK